MRGHAVVTNFKKVDRKQQADSASPEAVNEQPYQDTMDHEVSIGEGSAEESVKHEEPKQSTPAMSTPKEQGTETKAEIVTPKATANAEELLTTQHRADNAIKTLSKQELVIAQQVSLSAFILAEI